MAQRRPEESPVEAERCLALNPSFSSRPIKLCGMATSFSPNGPDHTLCRQGDAPQSPRSLPLYFLRVQGLRPHMLGEQDRAIEHLRQAVANNPDFPTPIAWLTAPWPLLATLWRRTRHCDATSRFAPRRPEPSLSGRRRHGATSWATSPFASISTKGCVSQVWKNESHCSVMAEWI